MPIDNIPSVIAHGILSHNNAIKFQHTSIAMQDVQEKRDCTIVPNGLPLHDYANVYFDARNPMMYKRRQYAKDLCVLCISPDILDLDGVVVSDMNAAALAVRFLSPAEMTNNLDFDIIYIKDWNDPNIYIKHEYSKKKCAEVLVPNGISFDYVFGAYVSNKNNANRLTELGFNKEIRYYPDIFFNYGG